MLRATPSEGKQDTFNGCKALTVVFLHGLVEKNANNDRRPTSFCI
jgi:hypothetical protein